VDPIALLRNAPFSPEDSELLAAAYHDLLAAVDLPNAADGTAFMLAAKIVELAKAGEWNRERIVARVIHDLKLPHAYRPMPPAGEPQDDPGFA
jgi:hypothetical protein